LQKQPSNKPRRAEKLSDAERHKRFLETAKEVGASNKPEDFDQAFKAVTSKPKSV
jgi:hypothetical protein